MEMNRFDIVLEIKLKDGDFVNSKLLLEAFDGLETVLYASDRNDIETVARELDIESLSRDAALERIRNFRNKRILLTDARKGSIEIIAAVAAVSYYIFDKTLGESLKEGYANSELHKRLKDLFRMQIDGKAQFITRHLRELFASRKKDFVITLFPPESPNQPSRILIEVTGDGTEKKVERIGSLGGALD